MYEFLDRLVNIALQFAISAVNAKSFDGNLCHGYQGQIVFPEIEYDQVMIRGMDIIVTSAETDDEARG